MRLLESRQSYFALHRFSGKTLSSVRTEVPGITFILSWYTTCFFCLVFCHLPFTSWYDVSQQYCCDFPPSALFCGIVRYTLHYTTPWFGLDKVCASVKCCRDKAQLEQRGQSPLPPGQYTVACTTGSRFDSKFHSKKRYNTACGNM